MPDLTIGSLFSGIGGLDLGVEVAFPTASVRFQVEQNAFCRRVLDRHFPNVDRSLLDVRDGGRETLPAVDLLIGGFPCTQISSAGLRTGLAGKDSGLFWEFVRITDELAPHALLIENVTSGKKLWVETAAAAFMELGYEVHAVTVAAADVGAPHRRLRTFLFCLDGDTTARHLERLLQERPRTRWPAPPGEEQHWDEAPRAVLSRPPNWSDRLKALGNACVPQQAHAAIALALGYGVTADIDGRPVNRLAWPTPTWRDARRSGNRTKSECTHTGYTLTDVICRQKVPKRWPTPTASRYGSTNNGCPHDGREAYATRGTPSLWQTARLEGGDLNPEWVEQLMGFKRGWTA